MRPSGAQDISAGWNLVASSGENIPIDFPQLTAIPEDGFYLLQKEVVPNKSLVTALETWLYFGNLDFPLEAWVNDENIYRRGSFPPKDIYVQSSFPAIFQVPRALWKTDGTPNKIILKVYIRGESMRLPSQALLGDKELADFQSWVKFLNADFFLMFFAMNLLGGAYFLSVWIGRREDFSRLWFSLSTLFMALYFLELGCPYSLFDGPAYRALMKACLGLSVGFIALFFVEFFNIHNKRWLKTSIIAVFLTMAFYVSLSPDGPTTLARFNLSLLPVEISILFFIYLLIRALVAKNPEALTLFIGIVISVGFGTHDVIFQLMGQMPVLWLQGFGFFALQCSMFLSLSLQSTRLYRTLEAYSKELLVQKTELANTNQAFARFVPKEFLAFLGKKSISDVALGDQVQQHMSILFTDIRDFTSLSETLSPHENFNLINSYLSRMAPVIREHKGIIDKYIGDAIMALYPEGAEGAIRCALAMRNTLVDYNTGRSRAGYTPLEMGIGIHSGSLMLGTIGDEHRMESTVISDAVNTASRLEGLTKVFGVPIIISETIIKEVAHIPGEFNYRFLGQLPLRGRTQGLGLYELIHSGDSLSEEKMTFKDEFEHCVRDWERDGSKAIPGFRHYQDRFPRDPTLHFFLGEKISK